MSAVSASLNSSVFPRIETIDDVLPAIEGRSEFIVAKKDDYTVINYAVVFPDTFDEGPHAAIRRECRGLIFDWKGRLISRPLHKFFNVGERTETSANAIDLGKPHVIMDKLDGSMVRPVWLTKQGAGGRWHMMTKMGHSDVAEQAQMFYASHRGKNYQSFIDWCRGDQHHQMYMTPIFEYVGPRNRIVVRYDIEALVLIGIRNTLDGTYVSYPYMQRMGQVFGIPVVSVCDSHTADVEQLVQTVRQQKDDIEGFVIRFDTGHMVKIKTEQYLLMHRSKEAASHIRHVVQAIIEEKVDDLKSMLVEEDRKRVEKIEEDFAYALMALTSDVKLCHDTLPANLTRAQIAQKMQAEKWQSWIQAGVFWQLDGKDPRDYVIQRMFKSAASQDKKWDEFVERHGLVDLKDD